MFCAFSTAPAVRYLSIMLQMLRCVIVVSIILWGRYLNSFLLPSQPVPWLLQQLLFCLNFCLQKYQSFCPVSHCMYLLPTMSTTVEPSMGMNARANPQKCLDKQSVLQKECKGWDSGQWCRNFHSSKNWLGWSPLIFGTFDFKNSWCKTGLHDLRQKQIHVLCKLVLDYQYTGSI